MVFLSEILGSEVVDPHQHRLGRVHDLTVKPGEPYPIVSGLLLSRRPVDFIPWSAVRAVAAREVALRGEAAEANGKGPEPLDIWLARDILDKQIVDTDGRRVVRVNDLQLTESGGNMLLVAADIGVRGILRRLGMEGMVKWLARLFHRDLPMVLVSWDVVDPIREAGPDQVRIRISGKRIAKLHPADIADIVEELGSKDRSAVFASLTEDVAADTLEEMEHDEQVSLIENMDAQRASQILEEMPPDEVADILADLDEERTRQILSLMEREEAEDVRGLLRYAEDTAGGLMTTEFAAIAGEPTAADCLTLVRSLASEAESVYYVYVVDEGDHLRGVVSLRDLIMAQPDQPVEDFMVADPIHVDLSTHAEEVAALLSKYNLIAVPVVDDEFRLRGIITVDDVLDQVLPESVKDRLPQLR